MQEVVELYLDDIIPNRFQPREKFDETALKELSDSIKEHGVIQPIIVRKIGEKYEIIAGERRYKASALAGLTKIPAIIRNLDDKEASKVALLENLQRRDLTAIEEARTYQKILELDSMTQEELGKTMGKSQAAIANKLRLLSLTDEVQEALLNDEISERHARSLLNIPNGNEQIEMLNRVIRNRMSVRELDNEIKKLKEGNQTTFNFESSMVDVKKDNETSDTPVIINDEEITNQKEENKEELVKPSETLFINDNIPTFEPVERKNAFINDLNQQEKETHNNIEEKPKEEEHYPRFINDFPSVAKPIVIDNDDTEVLTPTNNPEFINNFKYKEAIEAVKNIVPSLRSKGLNLNVEEHDLDGKYQIIINIDK